MTLEEMKLAVCEKLKNTESKPVRFWNSGEVNWPTEGLQVCHEAEKVLEKERNGWVKYVGMIYCIVDTDGIEAARLHDDYKVCHATYEQRLEALCRVWFPERFV